jgi:hypothetical protein
MKVRVPLSVGISSDTREPRMKLPEGNVPGLRVAELKHGESNDAVPVIPRLPSLLALTL